ncbi:TetR/AcrR family transcriptional regulator [Ectothiorhodospiraceae bacterium WFHF3C12]|nr:TetR/AcrR family transcriptional regulator [Ectothiorhodospiraceae bacterium WFHF3C12]
MNAQAPRRQRKSAEERRREIVDAVLALAYEYGPDSITAGAIAERVGFAQPAVFRHFPTMADVWLAVADTVGERVRERWDAVDDPALPAGERLRAVLSAHLGVITANPGLPSVLFSRELQAGNRELQARFARHMEGFVERLQSLITAGQRAGEIRPHLDARRAAYSIIGLLQGTAFRWALNRQSFDLQSEGMGAFEVLWSGLSSPTAA